MQAPSRKRLLLAAYVDALLFFSLWPSLEWWLPKRGVQLGWLVALFVFGALELLLLWLARSPGRWVLGIRTNADGSRQGSASHARETWWTMLLGVLGLLEGVKEISRWVSGLPPPPFMGLTLSWDAAAAVITISGLLTIVASVGILRCRPWAALLGLLVTSVALLSWLLSWELIPAWVDARTIASRAMQGIPLRKGELQTMRKVLPAGTIFGALAGSVWLFLAWLRFRRSDASAA